MVKSTDNRKGKWIKTAKTVDISDLNELLHSMYLNVLEMQVEASIGSLPVDFGYEMVDLGGRVVKH